MAVPLLKSWAASCQLLGPSRLKILFSDATQPFIYGIIRLWPLFLIMLVTQSISIYARHHGLSINILLIFYIPLISKLLCSALFLSVIQNYRSTYSVAKCLQDLWRAAILFVVFLGAMSAVMFLSFFCSNKIIDIAYKYSLIQGMDIPSVRLTGAVIIKVIGLIIGGFASMGSQFILFSVFDAHSIIYDMWRSLKKGMHLTMVHLPFFAILISLVPIANLIFNRTIASTLSTIPLILLSIISSSLLLAITLYWTSICLILYQRSDEISRNNVS